MNNFPFSFDMPEQSPGFLLWQTTMNWQRLVKKALEPHGISHAQFVIMGILLFLQGEKKDVGQIDLVEMSKLDKMTVSKCLRKLARMGLVARRENKEDTRAKIVRFTKSGIALTEKLVPIVEGIDALFFGQLENVEQVGLITVLRKLATDRSITRCKPFSGNG